MRDLKRHMEFKLSSFFYYFLGGGMMKLDEETMQIQKEFEELVDETARKLIELANRKGFGIMGVEVIVIDFIGNLIDYILAVKLGTILSYEYRVGILTLKDARKTFDLANLRPRYAKVARKAFDEFVKEEIDREVM